MYLMRSHNTREYWKLLRRLERFGLSKTCCCCYQSAIQHEMDLMITNDEKQIEETINHHRSNFTVILMLQQLRDIIYHQCLRFRCVFEACTTTQPTVVLTSCPFYSQQQHSQHHNQHQRSVRPCPTHCFMAELPTTSANEPGVRNTSTVVLLQLATAPGKS